MGDLTGEAATPPPSLVDRGDGVRLACRFREGRGPAIVFLPGHLSDMRGSKAIALDAWAAGSGRAMLRFDYSGVGESEGRLADGTIPRWRDDALALIDASAGDVVLVGSSMGGWIMLLIALARPERVRALVGIAAAPDFTDWGFSEDEKRTILREGSVTHPSAYGDPVVTTRAFWQAGEDQRILQAPIAIDCPVRLLHGQADPDVPAVISARIAERVRSADVQTLLVKDGDHRLSRPQDIALLLRTMDAVMENL